MNKGINVFSGFDGCSCGQIALQRARVKVNKYIASEIESDSIDKTQRAFPDTVQIGDICQVNVDDLPFIDLVIGGSPCQSFSRSGDNSGFDGKSGLFWEFVRVLSGAKKKNPSVKFLLENVMMKKEWEDIISDALGVEPIEIDSKLVSAQKRQRLYWTNIEGVKQPDDMGITIKDIMDNPPRAIDVVDTDLLYFEDGEYRVRNNTKRGYLTVENYDCINLDFPKSKTRRGRVSKQKSNTLNTGCNQGIFLNGLVKRLSPTECERLQNLPENYTTGSSDSKRKNMIGNGWTVDVISHIFKGLTQ